MAEERLEGMAAARGPALEVLIAFLRLGLTAFGGPIAHIGYFRRAFVDRRRWLDEAAYADIVALCQFLPGPTSSQVGMAIGLGRAGALGALAAWFGFTLPSAVLMTAFALTAGRMTGAVAAGLAHGLKLVAVAVVAQAVLGMARSLTPDARRAGIAVAAAAVVTLLAGAFGPLVAIAGGAAAGMVLCGAGAREAARTHLPPVSRGAGLVALSLFLALLAAGPITAAVSGSLATAQFDAFYRSGALVFGGGHVVLPLLRDAVVTPGWVEGGTFLTGYGAAQAAPGPLFTFAAYLGAVIRGPVTGPAGAALALLAIFLPGALILLAALAAWGWLRGRRAVWSAMSGANAAVVGILASALYNPLWTSAVLRPADFVAALAGFVLLVSFRCPPIVVVMLGGAYGLATAS